ncbi:MAG TPA: DNA polymerase II, partial [Gemmatimonadaceae bacterium]
FAVPETWTEADERRVVAEVAALFPALVQLEFEGRYSAMLSHEPKNYALLGYTGELVLRGVAFHSSRAEPYGEVFLRRAIGKLLVDDVLGVREVYLETLDALRRRELPTREVSSKVRLTKKPAEYVASRESRREIAYEALLAAGRTQWRVGERVRVYRAKNGAAALAPDEDEDEAQVDHSEVRDYDVEHYARLLRETYAARLARAFTAQDFAVVFASPEQLTLFTPPLSSIHSVLRELS